MNNEKIKQQRVKLKESALKVLHVICYILSGLFLVTLLISGLQSCGGKTATSTSAEGFDDSIPSLATTQWRFNDNVDASGTRSWDVDFTIESGTRFYGFDLYSGNLSYIDDNGDPYIVYGSSEWEDNNYRVVIFDSPIGSYNYDNPTLIEWLKQNAVQVTSFEKFTFNKTFNYNAPLGIGITQQFGGNTAQGTDIGGIYRIVINSGAFYSNGSFYDAIIVDYLNAGSLTYQIDGILRNGIEGNLSYFALGYRRIGVSTIDFINYRDYATGYKNDTAINYVVSSTTWVNDEYRYLTLYSSLTHDVEIKMNSFNNNNQNAYNGSSVGNEVSNVFTLVASAFTGLLPILGIYILPSVTLGTLLFVPLVATIVFVIIKTIKK